MQEDYKSKASLDNLARPGILEKKVVGYVVRSMLSMLKGLV